MWNSLKWKLCKGRTARHALSCVKSKSEDDILFSLNSHCLFMLVRAHVVTNKHKEQLTVKWGLMLADSDCSNAESQCVESEATSAIAKQYFRSYYWFIWFDIIFVSSLLCLHKVRKKQHIRKISVIFYSKWTNLILDKKFGTYLRF